MMQNTNQPINQSTNQPVNQLTNQPVNQSTSQPINQSTNQPNYMIRVPSAITPPFLTTTTPSRIQ